MALAGSDAPTVGAGSAPDGSAGGRAGPYRLIAELGHGGMGSVYLAVRDDDAFEQRVAIKILKRGIDTEAIVRRFRRERQILARLAHPYIATLVDGGTTEDGRPFFAMEYVDGQSIVAGCERRGLDTTARLDLFRKVCAAVQHAHQNLVVHRDIKPANVLVTADGTPKLLDFGIAKLLNPYVDRSTLAPTVGVVSLMTPEYASPEQVRGEAVTTATDVYSLGVLLYQLLAGRRPYWLASRAPADIARVVCEVTPPRPSDAVLGLDGGAPGDHHEETSASARTRADSDRLSRRLAGDLDTIVLKALAKEPDRRYASVDQFSEDIRRHLAGLPVLARPDTFRYRAAKFAKRNRAAVLAAAATLLALVAGIVATGWQAREARQERRLAERRFDDVRALANTLLFDVHDAIRDLPGSTPARQMIVSKALVFLDQLTREAGDRADLRRELAAAYLKVGDVQGQPLHGNLGDTDGARASYERAVRLYESLGGATASDPAIRHETARSYLRVSALIAVGGETKAALDLAQRAVAVIAPLASAPGADAGLKRETVMAYTRLADLLSATGAVPRALEERRRSLALMEAVAATAPADPENLRQLGIAHQKLAQTLGNPNAPNVGDHAGALRHLAEAARVFDAGAAADPASAAFRRTRAVVHSNTADVLMGLGREQEALAQQGSALAAFDALVAADPTNAAALNDVAISRSKYGELLDQNGRPREALEAYGRVLALHERMAAADPGNKTLQGELASDLNRLATVQARIGARAPSLTNHHRAIAISRDLTTDNPANVELRVAMALARIGRGDAYAQFARTAQSPADLRAAEQDYAEGVAILESLARDCVIEGTDLATLEQARVEWRRIRDALPRRR